MGMVGFCQRLINNFEKNSNSYEENQKYQSNKIKYLSYIYDKIFISKELHQYFYCGLFTELIWKDIVLNANLSEKCKVKKKLQ